MFHISFGGLGALFGGLSPLKPSRGDGTGCKRTPKSFDFLLLKICVLLHLW